MTTVMTVAVFQYQFLSQIPSLTPLIPNLPLHTILSPLHHQRAGLSLNTNQTPLPPDYPTYSKYTQYGDGHNGQLAEPSPYYKTP